VSRRTYRTFQALVLAGLGVFFIARMVDGRILLYINQRFVLLVLLGALGLLALAQALMRSRPPAAEIEAPDERPGWVIWLIALPLLVGLLVPQRPLGAGALATRGINTGAVYNPNSANAQGVIIPEAQRSILDWLRLYAASPNPVEFDGQAADVTGFVYHDGRLVEEQFMVGRFMLTCCAADATAVGMLAQWPEEEKLADDSWVRVRGTVELAVLDGRSVPLIRVETVEVVPEPIQPYLFP
jgi:putative membrane protein